MDTPRPRDPADFRTSAIEHERLWITERAFDLPREFRCPVVDLFSVIETRESRREFRKIELQDISTLLWFAQRHTGKVPGTIDRVKAPIPTAGGLASVKTAVISPHEPPWIYDPVRHQAEVPVLLSDVSKVIRDTAGEFFDIGEGAIMVFFACRSSISQYYEFPDSLVLREAGVLIGFLSLLAEALELAFCALGSNAEAWTTKLLGCNESAVVPAGAAVVGRR